MPTRRHALSALDDCVMAGPRSPDERSEIRSFSARRRCPISPLLRSLRRPLHKRAPAQQRQLRSQPAARLDCASLAPHARNSPGRYGLLFLFRSGEHCAHHNERPKANTRSSGPMGCLPCYLVGHLSRTIGPCCDAHHGAAQNRTFVIAVTVRERGGTYM